MQKVIDKDGRPWTPKRPLYKIPNNVEALIQKECDQLYHEKDKIQQFIILLPFYAEPMWPPKIEKVQNMTDFCFCVCTECKKPIEREFARLCLSFTIVIQHETRTRFIYWRPRLSCCDQIRIGVSPCKSILGVEMALKNVFNESLKEFDDKLRVPKKKCYVCETPLPCNNDICKHVMENITLTQTCEDRMYNIVNYFKEQQVDAVSPLIDKAGKCAQQNCSKQLNLSVLCEKCRRVAYCSKKCRIQAEILHRASQECVSFLKIWEW